MLARVLVVLDYSFSIYKDAFEARGVLMRLLVGRVVLHFRRIEDDEVSPVARLDQAAIGDSKGEMRRSLACKRLEISPFRDYLFLIERIV